MPTHTELTVCVASIMP